MTEEQDGKQGIN